MAGKMILRDLMAEAAAKLNEAGVPDAGYDARELYLHASGDTLADYTGKLYQEIPENVAIPFQELIARRAARIPLQQITGIAPFFGREFYVTEDVLIPRFDTETLVEAAGEWLRRAAKRKQSGGNQKLRILDLCTGSGCILLTLLLEGPQGTTGIGSDISDRALSVARENAKRLQVNQASFLRSDLFEEIDGTFDLITANPPYIRRSEIAELDEEVRTHEPLLALDGGEDGLSFYRRIAADAVNYIRPGGCLAFEIGYDQSEAVSRIMEEAGFTDIEVRTDLAGRDRAVLGEYRYVG